MACMVDILIWLVEVDSGEYNPHVMRPIGKCIQRLVTNSAITVQ